MPVSPLTLSRRTFAGGFFALGATLPLGGLARAQGLVAPPALAPAIAAIRAHAMAHKAFFNLPGLTVGLVGPNGFASTFDIGVANMESGRPIGADTLFQVGSISKLMTAFVIHRLAADGKFALDDPVSTLLPTVPLPKGSGITVQQLLDHRSGLPGDAPLFPDGGLWTGFAPGTGWSYSNTGYDILGKLAEQAGGKPLDRLLTDFLFKPLGMSRTLGAIVAEDRSRYAQGYEAADNSIPYVRGVRLAPANWVEVTFGAGCVASVASDMNRLIGALAAANAKTTPLPGLDATQTEAFLTHSAPTDGDSMRYGNGFMHVSNGERRYLHHTGGMVSFSSAFHLDKASGFGAFASSSLTGLAGYRPSALTRFAVDALTDAAASLPLPAPPLLDDRLKNPTAYLGIYEGPSGRFEILPGAPLTISANGRSAQLQSWGKDVFRTTHPDFSRFSLMFERVGAKAGGASWGPSQFVRAGATAPPPTRSNPALAKLAGRYSSDSPWWGIVEVVERGGRLWIGTEAPLALIAGDLWRIGDDKNSPERARFADPIGGRPQTFYFSGEKFVRHDI